MKQQIINMTLNDSGMRDIVGVLRVSSATGHRPCSKKEPTIKQVNERLLKSFDHARSYGEVGNTGLFSGTTGTSGGKRLKVLEQKK